MVDGGLGVAESLALALLAAATVRIAAGRRGLTLCNEPVPGVGLAGLEAAMERMGLEHSRLGGRVVSPHGPVDLVAEEAPGGVRVLVELKAWFLAALIPLALLQPLLAAGLASYGVYTAYTARSHARKAASLAAS